MINLPYELVNLAKYFDESTPLYLVGGAVRNHLLGYELGDYDIASSLTIREVENILPKEYVIECEYSRTGTIVIRIGKFKFEYTTFRVDSYPLSSGVHTPTSVEFTRDIILDANRRDFTCNALYYDIIKGEIIDLVGGVEDIENRVIRTVKDPNITLSEDALRIMRLARFSAELNFAIERETFLASKNNAYKLKDISTERIHDELVKIIKAKEKYNKSKSFRASYGIDLLVHLKAMQYIIPELIDCIGVEQNPDYHIYDVYNHILKVVDYLPRDIRIAGLLHDIAKPILLKKYGVMYGHDKVGESISKEILERLKFSNNDIKRYSRLVGIHMYNLDNKTRDCKLRCFIVENFEYIDDYIKLRVADGLASRCDIFDRASIDRVENIRDEIVKNKVPLRIVDMEISGNDLLENGYEGVEIGKKLNELWIEQIKNGVRYDKETLLKRIKK